MKHVFIIVIAALLLAACGETDQEAARQKKIDGLTNKIHQLEKKRNALLTKADTAVVEKVINVKTQELKLDTLSRDLEFVLNLLPQDELYLAPTTPGRIEQIKVDIGDHVRKGQLLVQMDKTQLTQAKIQLEQLEVDFQRISALHESNSISQQQYDQMKTQLAVTQKNVKYLEENTTLLAPYSGVITGRYYENGELYSGAPNTQVGKAAIVTLQKINSLKAEVNISETYFPQIKKGEELLITSKVYPDVEFKGKIQRIHPVVDQMTRSFKVELTVANDDLKLRPGMFSKALLILEEEPAIVVPAISVLQQEGTNNRYLFKNENGVAKRVNIKIGKRFDDRLEVISDKIQVGDQLVVVGQSLLSNGDKVKVVNK